MTPGIDPSTAYDIQDLLRKKGILKDVASPPQQPANITPWQDVQPPPQDQSQDQGYTPANPNQQIQGPYSPVSQQMEAQYRPTPQMFGVPPQLQIPPLPPMDKYNAARKALEEYPAEKTAGAVDESGKPVFPRSKWKTGVFAPLMLGGLLSNPRLTMRHLDDLTRKGYMAYQMQDEATRASLLEQFKIQSQALNQNLNVWKDTLAGAKDAADYQMKYAQLVQHQQMAPLEREKILAEIQHLQVQNHAERWDNVPWELMTENGPVMAALERPTDPSGKPRYIDLTTMDPITKYSSPKRLDHQDARTLERAWLESKEAKQRADGKPLDDAFYTGLKEEAARIQGAEPWQRMITAMDNRNTQEQNRLIQQRELDDKRRKHDTFKTAQNDFNKVFNPISIALEMQRADINQARQALLDAKRAVQTGDLAGVSAWGGKVKAVLSSVGGLKPVSRYTIAEMEAPDMQASAINRGITEVLSWFGNPTGKIPLQTIDQLLRYVDLMDADTGLQEQVRDKYKTEVLRNSVTDNMEPMFDIQQRLHDDMERIRFAEPQKIQQRQQEQKQRNLPDPKVVRKQLEDARKRERGQDKK